MPRFTALPAKQSGMTLLELMLVVTILSAVAFMTLSQVTDNTSQIRFEDTRNRLELIREAIIGDTSRTINGQPEIRGFVADIGRLPNNLRELIERNFCSNSSYSDQASCESNGEYWFAPQDYQHDTDSGLWSGWNGPYLSSSTEAATGNRLFLDGWGNDDDTFNYGWFFSLDEDDTTDSDSDTVADNDNDEILRIQSLGLDGAANPSDSSEYAALEVYERDYPFVTDPSDPDDNHEQFIRENDYRVTLSAGITINVSSSLPYCSDRAYETESTCTGAGKTWSPASACSDPNHFNETDCTNDGDTWITTTPSCVGASGNTESVCTGNSGTWTWPTQTVCARLFQPTDGAIPNLSTAPKSTNQHSVLLDGSDPKTYTFTFGSSDQTLSLGMRSIGIYWYGSSCTESPFPSSRSFQTFSVIPGYAISNVTWPLNR